MMDDQTVVLNVQVTLRVADYIDDPERAAMDYMHNLLQPHVRDLHDWRGQFLILSGFCVDHPEPEVEAEDTRSEFIEMLRLAVAGPYAGAANRDDLETLLWKVGDMRRRMEDAHNRLDAFGIPRESHGGELTVAGRIDMGWG